MEFEWSEGKRLAVVKARRLGSSKLGVYFTVAGYCRRRPRAAPRNGGSASANSMAK
jgi:K+-transporting ATPase c subunit